MGGKRCANKIKSLPTLHASGRICALLGMPGRFQACPNASEHSEFQFVPGRSSGMSRSIALQ
eukprot:5515533-Alexandrium_andersonii.AAC.1